MVYGIVLAGGIGSRIGGNLPKQFLRVGGKPLIGYCLETVESVDGIDAYVIVAAERWRGLLTEWMAEAGCRRFAGFADPGESRQQSVYSGLWLLSELGAKEEDLVLIHDAVRPCAAKELFEACIRAAEGRDGAIPALPATDTVYQSADGATVTGLLNRDELYLVQTPEAFRFGRYWALNRDATPEELATCRGSSQIAAAGGMKLRLFCGSEENFKIDTPYSLRRFRQQVGDVDRG